MLKKMLAQYRKNLLLMAVLAFGVSIAILGQGYLIVTIIDRIFLQGVQFVDVIYLIGILVFALLIRTILRSSINKIGMSVATDVKINLRVQLLDHFTNRPAIANVKRRSGERTSYFLDIVDEIDRYFSQYIPQMIQSMIIPLVLLIVIFVEHWATGVIILITAPFIPIFMVIIGVKTGDKSKEQLTKMAAFSGTFLDTLQGLQTLKLFGRAKQQRERIKQSSLSFRDATMEVLKVAFTNSLALEFISMLSIGLIALEVAIRMIIIQDTSFATGFLMLILAPEFFNKLKELGSAFHSGKASMGAAKKLEELLEETSEPVKWGAEELDKNQPPTLELSEAAFGYDEGFQSKPLSVSIQPFEKVAIIGATGAGKSTLLNVLSGLFPLNSGSYLINGLSQHQVSEKAWFDKLSYITQDAYLFSGTIEENISLGSSQKHSQHEIKLAAEEAGIYEWIQSLPNGLQTSIGEGGRGLSGGEKQRVLMARAFLKKPAIILFDEPTTGLDLQTERILQTSMQKLSEQSTVITVAHRLYTIRSADKIILLEAGAIRAIGTHEELWRQDKMYREMVDVQQGRTM
ncbi:thiol reductant ABC exporter subunit CydD [Alkalihalobacillus sp. 1P02AB]|uniref:thiol reductant ABC exporter subunit CydD n=1 Tax=Alkalihalobacillus sp. 1P02AB TaxID=3132260 RepID=UPI0039A4FBBC